MKALHPSDPMTEVRGIPDQSAMPSLCMNYQSTFTLSPESGSTGTWEFDATLIPHPICFMSFARRTSYANSFGCLLNSQIDGNGHWQKYIAWKNLAQRWRLAYMSVTVYQDGPDLANQGTIVVSQPPVSPRRRNICSLSFAGGAWVGPLQSAAQTCQWTAEDKPDYTRSQAMPNAYFNKSKEGSYIPLKLTETCQDWFSESDEMTTGVFDPATLTDGSATGVLNLGSSGPPQADLYPFYDLTACRLDSSGRLVGQATSPPLSGNWGHICAKNLAVTTSYSFFVRCGIEMQVSPSSTLSPQLKLSPPYDPIALSTYFSICRELKDAYPADYNTTGKLWGVIKQALNALDPVISVMPGARVVNPLVKAGVATGDILVARRKKKKQKEKRRRRAAKVGRNAPPPPPPPPPPVRRGYYPSNQRRPRISRVVRLT